MSAPNIVFVSDIRLVTDYANVTTTTSVITENPTDSDQVYKINSIVVSNIDGTNDGTVRVELFRGSTAYYLAYDVSVDAETSFVVMSKDNSFYLIEGDQIRCSASADNDFTIMCSYEIISEEPITV